MRWLYRLEYKFGRYYIQNLMAIIVGGMVVAYVMDRAINLDITGSLGLLSFWRGAILQGQVWRVLSFIFIPPNSGNIFWMAIQLFIYFQFGRMLEMMWGGFKLNVYYLVGILGAILAGFISPVGYTSNVYLNSSLFLAIATQVPDSEFRLFFILPIKGKWLAALYFVFMLPDIINAFTVSAWWGLNSLIVLAFSLLNYFIFFGPTLIRGAKEQYRIWQNRRNWRNRNRR